MAPCRNGSCEFPANIDPTYNGFCCDKCEARFNGEDWGFGGKKKHTAYCSSNEATLSAAANSASFYSAPPPSDAPAVKCASPFCEYTKHSNPAVSLLYCCEKCEGIDKREPWAEGGKKHYKSCEHRIYTVKWGENWVPPVLEDPDKGKPLERHQDAKRDTRPAWMTKGVGINTEVFGETKGDLIKPGMTREDLERLENTVRVDDPDDPMAAFMAESTGERARSRTPPRRAPLPDQKEQYWKRWE